MKKHLAILLAIVMACIFAMFQKYLVEGIATSGLKG